MNGDPDDDLDAPSGEDSPGEQGRAEQGRTAQSTKSALVKPSRKIDRNDPLSAYMRDVQRYPLLSREEEQSLAEHYAKTGDIDAARKLVVSNLRLVVKIAYDYRQAYKNLLDLVQEGNIGLMQAVKKYDPYRGVKLSSYAAWWIRAYMLRYILSNHRLVKLGTTQAQRKLFFNLKKEKAKLTAMGIAPTHEKIAERLQVPLSDVVTMDRRLARADASLDAPISNAEGSTTTRAEVMSDGARMIEDVIADNELGAIMSAQLKKFGETLEGKERRIFEARLLSEDPMTLQNLGEEFGVSRERVRQIEKRLLGRMKHYLQSELDEDVLEVFEA